MAEYLVEIYVARDDHATARHHAERVEAAGAELSRAGRQVRCLRSIFVPEDETCFLLLEADSAEVVTEVVRRAGLRPEHVSAADSVPTTTPTGPDARLGPPSRKDTA
jgi:Protein of unknown function (DUF4242)